MELTRTHHRNRISHITKHFCKQKLLQVILKSYSSLTQSGYNMYNNTYMTLLLNINEIVPNLA